METESQPSSSTYGRESRAWTDIRAWAFAHGRSLLFVDDNRLLLELISRTFEKLGAGCRTASTHDAAVRALKEDAALRVVVLDFEMPEGDVATLIRRLRSVRPEVVLVGTSGGDRRRHFAERGVNRFVPKPWRLGDLVEVSGG
jgi:two-component system OmpR family response regulator